MRRNRVRLSESQLHRLIKESVKGLLSEYGGYDRQKVAYGDQNINNEYMKHLHRVGTVNPDGDGKSYYRDQDKVRAREKSSKENLDPLRLRMNDNPYRRHLDTVSRANKIKSDSMDRLRKSVLRESSGLSIATLVSDVIQNALKNEFGDEFVMSTGMGCEVTNPNDENDYCSVEVLN